MITFEQAITTVLAALFGVLVWLLKGKVASWDNHIVECNKLREQDAVRFAQLTTKLGDLTDHIETLIATLNKNHGGGHHRYAGKD